MPALVSLSTENYPSFPAGRAANHAPRNGGVIGRSLGMRTDLVVACIASFGSLRCQTKTSSALVFLSAESSHFGSLAVLKELGVLESSFEDPAKIRAALRWREGRRTRLHHNRRSKGCSAFLSLACLILRRNLLVATYSTSQPGRRHALPCATAPFQWRNRPGR